MTLNRRQFLQLTGFSALVATFPIAGLIGESASSIPSAPPFNQNSALLARTLSYTFQFAKPEGVRLHGLPPDIVTPILDVDEANGWMRVQEGYIRIESAQPILASAYRPPTSITPPESNLIDQWVQVASASAFLYKNADVTSTRVADVGHGGIMKVVDYLPPSCENGIHWIGVADEDRVVWTQAHLWRIFDEPPLSDDDSRWLHIDCANHELTAYQGDQAVFGAPIMLPEVLDTGEYILKSRSPGTRSPVNYHGVPYILKFGEYHISGTYWHNQFKQFDIRTLEQGVETTIHVAEWLYAWLPSRARIRVV